MESLTYKYLSNRDFRDANILYNSGSYDSACRFFQQAVEKYLKHFIQLNGSVRDTEILKSHNIVKLYDRVVELEGLELDKEDRKMMSVLKDYYYDLNYPGADFRELEQDEANEAKQFVERFLQKLKS